MSTRMATSIWPSFVSRSSSRSTRLFNTMLEWRARSRERHALSQLDDRMLRDIGLTRADVHREATKPFWRA
jgi:uncharacterized protein YjiS (DUF1127 family)